jgi:hypothetical protein
VKTARVISCQIFSTFTNTKQTVVETSEFKIIGWQPQMKSKHCKFIVVQNLQIHSCAKLAIILSSDFIYVDNVECE